MKKVVIENCELYLADCRDVLPLLGSIDAVATDPPYGRKEPSKKNLSRGLLAAPKDYGFFDWDSAPPPKDLFDSILKMSNFQIIFGGNYFDLPPSSCWFVWDKKNGLTDFADCELAWTSLKKAVRLIRWQWNGMLRKGSDVREHPTQKPVGVMKWCIDQLPDSVETILDPFMGSGTTGVACVKTGKKFIGIEREEKYFDIACKRIEEAYRQPDLFIQGVP